MPYDQWECTSVLALYNSLPVSLAEVAKALHMDEDKQKDIRGKALINYFSKPCKPTKANGGRTRNRPSDAPDKWATYISTTARTWWWSGLYEKVTGAKAPGGGTSVLAP